MTQAGGFNRGLCRRLDRVHRVIDARHLKAEHDDLTTRGRVEIARKIESARELGDLSENEREAFYLVDVLGHSREEAAVIAGVPPSTMRSRAARARERLAAGSNVVVLSPENAAAFPTSDAVNEALDGLLRVAKTARLTSRSSGRPR